MLRVNELDGFGVSGAEGPKLTYLGSYPSTVGSTATSTFTSVNCGNKSGLLLVGITAFTANARTISSVTVGGTAMAAEVTRSGLTGFIAAVYKLAVSPTASANIVINWGGGSIGSTSRYAIHVWLLEGNASDISVGNVQGNGTATISGAIAAAAVVGVAIGRNAVAWSWSGLTEQYDATIGGGSGNRQLSAADGLSIDGTVSATNSDATGNLVIIVGYD